MVRLQAANQNASVDEHTLNPVGIDALAADWLIGKLGSCAIVAFRPGMKLTSPFFRIGSLKMGDRSEGGMQVRQLEQPLLDR